MFSAFQRLRNPLRNPLRWVLATHAHSGLGKLPGWEDPASGPARASAARRWRSPCSCRSARRRAATRSSRARWRMPRALAATEQSGVTIDIRVYNTDGDPATAATVARQAVQEGADVILGPLRSESAAAVGVAVANSGISVLSFSNNAEVAGDNVFVSGQHLRQYRRSARLLRRATGGGQYRRGPRLQPRGRGGPRRYTGGPPRGRVRRSRRPCPTSSRRPAPSMRCHRSSRRFATATRNGVSADLRQRRSPALSSRSFCRRTGSTSKPCGSWGSRGGTHRPRRWNSAGFRAAGSPFPTRAPWPGSRTATPRPTGPAPHTLASLAYDGGARHRRDGGHDRARRRRRPDGIARFPGCGRRFFACCPTAPTRGRWRSPK